MRYSSNVQVQLTDSFKVVRDWTARFLRILKRMVIVGVVTRRPSSQAGYKIFIAGFGWCELRKSIIQTMFVLFALMGASHAYAAVQTAGGATIHNAVTLSFNGQTSQAFVDVKVKTLAVAPIIAVNTTTQNTTPGTAVTYTYTITNKTNGSDSFSFNAVSVDAGGVSTPALDMAATGTSSASFVLAATITNATNSVANTFVIPAGSEADFAAGDTVVILNNIYQVAVGGVALGTPESLLGAEVPTVITVTPVAGAPVLAVASVPAGLQIGEQQTFNLVLTAGAPSGSHTVNLIGATFAKDTVTANPVGYTTSALSGNETTTVVASANITFVKEVRNISSGSAYSQVLLQAQSTDVLEFRITVTEPTNVLDQAAGLLTDEVPALTSYIAGSTTLNSTVIPDGPSATLPLSTANGGLALSSSGAASGVIAAGQSAVVIFRVKVD